MALLSVVTGQLGHLGAVPHLKYGLKNYRTLAMLTVCTLIQMREYSVDDM
jgi:hypothetical protein